MLDVDTDAMNDSIIIDYDYKDTDKWMRLLLLLKANYELYRQLI